MSWYMSPCPVVEGEIVIQLQARPTDRQVGRNINQSQVTKQEMVRRKHARADREAMLFFGDMLTRATQEAMEVL
jgi:uncharacterized protein with PIN domain